MGYVCLEVFPKGRYVAEAVYESLRIDDEL